MSYFRSIQGRFEIAGFSALRQLRREALDDFPKEAHGEVNGVRFSQVSELRLEVTRQNLGQIFKGFNRDALYRQRFEQIILLGIVDGEADEDGVRVARSRRFINRERADHGALECPTKCFVVDESGGERIVVVLGSIEVECSL